MFRVGYEHSKFDQAIPSFTFDNPLYATDYNGFNRRGGAGYDPSGYTNGNGAAMGRMAMAAVQHPGHVQLAGHGQAARPARRRTPASCVGANQQDEALIPWTTNSLDQRPPRLRERSPSWPTCRARRRGMRVNYATGTMNVNSRPIKDVTLTARYRYNSRSDFTRPFDAVEYVRFDAVPEETGGVSEPFKINRNTFDVDASFTPIPLQRHPRRLHDRPAGARDPGDRGLQGQHASACRSTRSATST